jgi:SAM-dependent methyltransferase
MDRAYLNSIGWRGIRVRKANLQTVLRDAVQQTHQEGRPVRLLDIASGPGRYVLEALRDEAQIPMTAMLRDYKSENVEAARRLAEEMGLTNVTVTQGDAFDRAALAALAPKPTIGIVSGLYELFPDNAPVLNSLRGLADAIKPGGFLIYTNQPWHPQMEFIARVLTNREGRPWIMRRRTQAEMDELARAAGFEKLREEIDPWGIFSVSLARRMK